ncbi:MAG: hypothetical protein ACI9WS_000457 [Paraglaciecola psychrophila]|jgi:hypothetical protein
MVLKKITAASILNRQFWWPLTIIFTKIYFNTPCGVEIRQHYTRALTGCFNSVGLLGFSH